MMLPGLYVRLDGYRPLARPLSLEIRGALRTEHPKRPLYFPRIPYQDTLRTFQTYLAKLPRAVLDVLAELGEAVMAVLEEPRTPAPTGVDVEAVESEVASAEGRPRPARPGKGQGFRGRSTGESHDRSARDERGAAPLP